MNELYHYGIPGMKWGHHKYKTVTLNGKYVYDVPSNKGADKVHFKKVNGRRILRSPAEQRLYRERLYTELGLKLNKDGNYVPADGNYDKMFNQLDRYKKAIKRYKKSPSRNLKIAGRVVKARVTNGARHAKTAYENAKQYAANTGNTVKRRGVEASRKLRKKVGTTVRKHKWNW